MKSKLFLIAIPLCAFAQALPPLPSENQVFFRSGSIGGEHTFDYVSTEFSFDGATVKNAPYSAQSVTETTQTLGDGNRIHRKTSSNLYRDSEGRTRHEESLGAIGPYTASPEPAQSIFINDPVANTNLILDTRNKTVRKLPAPKMIGMMGAGAGGPGPVIAQRMQIADVGAENATIRILGQAPMTDDKNLQKESLGTQTIEGVLAEGTRTTVTIAAGAIGNDQPILIVSERWYSPELKTVVMSKRNDPRMGETVYRLTNINRSEPAASLFQAPPDYTVADEKMEKIRAEHLLR